ncbi:MAG: SpoIID/LytB domain-containing protein [Lachnospiraceae bacterium]|jgi:stage II sporulation protein D|nr:SpoIID/LytB domain-containing protein [Lachnospiraceae bacterium]
MRQFLAVLFLMVMIPYATTLAWTGRLDDGNFFGFEETAGRPGDKRVIVIRNGRETEIGLEDFLLYVVAKQVPAEYGRETIKAQAVLARTYIYREMNGADTIYEEALDLDVWSRAQMEKQWGSGNFSKNYGKIKEAVEATAGMVIVCDGELIEPFFCRAAAGCTRSLGGQLPYLKQAESPGDREADGFLDLRTWTAGELADRINAIPDGVPVSAAALPGEIQIVERDGAGYVLKLQIGGKTYSGEEVQHALGLPSSCYSFTEFDGKIRTETKGIGHGYGFSQAGANALEREGHDFRELLNYYFQGIEIRESLFENAE